MISVAWVLVFASFIFVQGAQLRSDEHAVTSFSQIVGHNRVKTSAVSGNYPSPATFWVGYEYSDTGCTQQIATLTYVLNTCLAAKTYSEKYTCSGGIVTFSNYSDTSCQTLTKTKIYDNTCLVSGPNPIGVKTLKVIDCSTTNPFDVGSSHYILAAAYADNQCTKLTSAVGILNGYCYSNGIKFDWPNEYKYSTSDCSGTGTLIDTATTTCAPLTSSGSNDPIKYQGYEKDFDINAAPKAVHLGIGMVLSTLWLVSFLLW